MENSNSGKIELVSQKGVAELFNYSISLSTAQRMITRCRTALNKQEHQVLSIKEFIKYYDITL